MTETNSITVRQWATRYRENGLNIVPLYNHSKNPKTTKIKKNGQWIFGWTDLQTRMVTEEEFEYGFAQSNLTGLGVFTGKISGIDGADADMYKPGGMAFEIPSPLISKTVRNGEHRFFKHNPALESIGFREKVYVEFMSEGHFMVLPPSDVWIRDSKTKEITQKGTYSWITPNVYENLPAILKSLPMLNEENLVPFRKGKDQQTDLHTLVEAPLGTQHNNLRTIALAAFNRFKPEEWDIAKNFIRDEAKKFNPPHPTDRVETMIRDCMNYVRNNPTAKNQKQEYQQKKAIKTAPVIYSAFSEEDFSKGEKRNTLKTGLPIVDTVFTFHTGFYIICANPGAGKGWFALWLIQQFYLLHNTKSVYFSLEMPEPLVRTRILQQWSTLTEEQFKQGSDTTTAKKLMQEDAIIVYPFGLDDTGYQTPDNFEKDFLDFYNKGYRIFHFDHLHELEGANVNDENQKVIETWGKKFQTICKQYPDIWLFIYAQPNGSAGAKPILRRTDIAGSKSITQKCEFFLSLNRSLALDENTKSLKIDSQNRDIILWIDKNRISAQQHRGAKIYLSRTGNFTEQLDSDVYEEHGGNPFEEETDTSDFIDDDEGSNQNNLSDKGIQNSGRVFTITADDWEKKLTDIEVIQQEDFERRILNQSEKNSAEYGTAYHRHFKLREIGIKRGLFTNIFPLNHEPWMDNPELKDTLSASCEDKEGVT